MGRFLALIGGTSPALLAAAASAQMACTFQTECFEADGCQSSAFALEVALDGEGAMTFVTEFGDIEVLHFERAPGTLYALGRGVGATYLLSAQPDGARATVHMNGPISVTYVGSCEGQP